MTPPRTGREIAVVGLAGRFPGARSAAEFWANLVAGVESVTSFTDQELVESGVEASEFGRPDYVRARAILDDLEGFDAAFFGFSPLEAALVDPQQRLFLECAWEALEGAGYEPGTPAGAVGVYAGLGQNHYLEMLRRTRRLRGVYAMRAELGNHR